MMRLVDRGADLVLYRGNVLAMDAAQTRGSGVAIRDGRILFVGTDDQVLGAAAPGARRIDVEGRTVIPGLIDAHTHLEITAYSRYCWTDIRGLSPAEIVQRVGDLARERAAGEWIVLQGTFGQQLPGRDELDRVAPAHPVAVRQTMHVVSLNSRALAVSGITQHMVAPPGIRIHRDEHGRPTGLIEEGWDLLSWRPPDFAQLRQAIAETARQLFVVHGVTTLYEVVASTTGVAALQDLQARGELPLRVGLAYTAPPGHQPLADIEHLGRLGLRTGFGSEYLSLLALKIFIDGGRHGAFRSSDLGKPAKEWGLLTRTPQALAQEVAQAFRAGIQVWMHAIGDLAQECAVSAIEQATIAVPDVVHRTRVEHFGNELYDPQRLQRLLNAGGIPAPNPSFIFAEPDDPAKRIPPGVTKYGFRTLLDAGARPPGNSDTAGAQPFAANPWFGISCMVNRRNRNGVLIDPEEAVSPLEALRAYTIDAAASSFEEDVKGSLEPGKYADIAVLSADPLSIEPERLSEITSDLTIVGGVVRHSRLDSVVAE